MFSLQRRPVAPQVRNYRSILSLAHRVELVLESAHHDAASDGTGESDGACGGDDAAPDLPLDFLVVRVPESRVVGSFACHLSGTVEPPAGRHRPGDDSDHGADPDCAVDVVILTPGQAADTCMLSATLEQIRVPVGHGRPRTRPDRVMADKGYPSRANRAWLRERGIAATIPERDDQIAHRRKRRGRPIDFGDEQRHRYRGRNVVERCFNKLKQWRGIAMRSDKLARNYHAGLCLAATLHWLTSTS